jgi:spermidine/putrescine transport system permease protein
MFVVFPLSILFYYAFISGGGFSLNSFAKFFSNAGEMKILGRSLTVSLAAAAICILIGYPAAYILSQTNFKKANVILLLLIAPMWANSLLRIVATRELLYMLSVERGMTMLIIGLVLDYLPFMILPIYTTLSNIDKKYNEAGLDLGASHFRVFVRIILPLSIPGIISGFLMVFAPIVSTYYITDYLAPNEQMVGNILNYYFSRHNYESGSAVAIILLFIVLLCVLATNKLTKIGNKRGGLW